MSLMGAEAIADATVKYMTDFAAVQLAAVNARGWAVPITVEPPVVIRVTDPLQEREPVFPVWYVMPERTTVDPFKGGGRVTGTHRFQFAALVYHPGALPPDHDGGDPMTPAEMARRLAMRHALAIVELLTEMSVASVDPDYYANGSRVMWGTDGSAVEIVFMPTFTSRSGEYLTDVRVLAGAQLVEVV